MFALPQLPLTLRIVPTLAAAQRQAGAGPTLCWQWSALVAGLAAHGEQAMPRIGRLASEWALLALLGGDGPGSGGTGQRGPPGSGVAAMLASRACEAAMLLQPAAIAPSALSAAAAKMGGEQPFCAAYAAYRHALASAGLCDQSAALSEALALASQPSWPGMLAAIERVEFALGCELTPPQLLLAQAIARSGRACVVEVPQSLQEEPAAERGDGAAEATAAQADAFAEGILGAIERCGDIGIEAAFVAPPEAAARTDAWQAPAGPALVAQVVAAVGRALQAGAVPNRIAIVLPPSQEPLWRRSSVCAQLRRGLAAAGLATQGSLPWRLVDTPLGQALSDVLRLADEWHASAAAPQLSLPAWGRLVAWCGTGLPVAGAPPAADHMAWPWAAEQDVVDVAALPALLLAEEGGEQAAAVTRAAQARAVLERLVLPLVLAGSLSERIAALARAAQVLMAHRPPAAEAADGLQLLWATLARAERELAMLPGLALHPALQLAALAGALRAARLPVASRSDGICLLRPEDVVGGDFSHVFLLAPHEDVWFRPALDNPFVPAAVLRSLTAMCGVVLCHEPMPSLRASSPRDRGAWLWQAALAAASTQVTACLLLPPGGESAWEPSCQALLGTGKQASELPLAPPLVQQPYMAQMSLPALAQAAVARGQAGLWPAGSAQQRTQRASWRPAALGPAAAALSADVARSAGAAWLLREHSATALDTLAQCRFRYAAQALWGFGEQPISIASGTTAARGSAMHRALHDLVAAWRRAGSHWPATAAARADLLVQSEQRFWQQTLRYLPVSAVHQRLRRATLEQVWQAVEEQLGMLWVPGQPADIYTEVAFGTHKTLPALLVPGPNGQLVRVAGSVDRIDVSERGCRVLDYKSRKAARKAGRHLQLGLYAMVAAEHFAKGLPLSLAWLPLQGEGVGAPHAPSDFAAEGEQLPAYVAQTVWQHVQPLLAGEMTPNPDQASTCGYCRFADLCQHAEDVDAEPIAAGEGG